MAVRPLILIPIILLAIGIVSCSDQQQDDDKFVYITLAKKINKNNYTRQVKMKIPKDYVSKFRKGMALFYLVLPDLQPYKPAVKALEQYDKTQQAALFREIAHNRVPVSLWSSGGVWLRDNAGYSSLTYMGRGPYQLSHYKRKTCEGKPFDRSLIKQPSFEDGCYSLNRAEYYISPLLENGRAIQIKCDVLCVVSTALTPDGIDLHYSYPAEYLKDWRKIDKAIFALMHSFIVSNTAVPNNQKED